MAEVDSVQSEAGVIASLIKNPNLYFFAEELLPRHFTVYENRVMYTAIEELINRGITTIDAYNIEEALGSENLRPLAASLSVQQIQEMIDMADILARTTEKEYKLLASNIIDSAFRREMIDKLEQCKALCSDKTSQQDIQKQVYDVLDGIAIEYSTKTEVPQYKDVVDKLWDEVKARQGDGYAGIPFKFPTLNEFATIEPGELFIFGAEAKQGKSMMLLNCTVDLLRKDKSVLYIDSELNSRMFTQRLIANLTGIEYKRLRDGNYNEDEEQTIKNVIGWLKTRKFTHIYLPMFDQQTIYTIVKKTAHSQGLDVLVVDYFKGSSEGDAFNSYQELGHFVDLVKNKICGEMNVAGIGAAQATVTGKLADSAKIGRNASTIAMIMDKTPEEIAEDGAECGNKKLRIVLNRNGAQHLEGEYIDLKFDGNHILYEEAKQHSKNEPF